MIHWENVLAGADTDAAIHLAAGHVVAALNHPSGRRCVALAGGGTPKSLYSALTQSPWRGRVDFSNVEWFWGDERAVPPDRPDSNYRMARETLLAPLGIDPARIHRMPADAADLPASAESYERTIRDIVPAGKSGIPVFDLVLLGIGADGHTAGLFPGSAGLNEQNRLVVAHEVPSLRMWRMTMTFPLLKAAARILFLVTGPGKAEIMSQILGPQADPGRLPAASFCGLPDSVTWILNADAARLVRPIRPV
ncbi:MAG TPA: 6-phosphogluconolactonase [Phycisphaerae bacterium]|nr:6-phosphogluconolactonase [Phycisphaerae bacterium]